MILSPRLELGVPLGALRTVLASLPAHGSPVKPSQVYIDYPEVFLHGEGHDILDRL